VPGHLSDAQLAVFQQLAHSNIVDIARAQANQPSLNDVLDAERVIAQLDDTSLQQLLPFLPEGQRTVEDLRSQLRSPQVQQTISRLSSILNSSQYGHVMASLGLPQASGFGVSGFIDTIQTDQKKHQDSKNTDKDKAKDHDKDKDHKDKDKGNKDKDNKDKDNKDKDKDKDKDKGTGSGTAGPTGSSSKVDKS